MIELIPGIYYTGGGPDAPAGRVPQPFEFGYPGDGSGDGEPPNPATSATIWDKHGTPENPITVCGSRETIIDGTDPVKYKAVGMRIANSEYIRLSGFTLQWALKGLDVQNSTNCEISHVKTTNTLAEGIRLRFSSQHNTVKSCDVSNTGRVYDGYGEGIYIGTSKKNSINYGLPPDNATFNTIQANSFGPGVLSENIDNKEYSYYTTIKENTFDGKDSVGSQVGATWVVMRASHATIANNNGYGLRKPSTGAGFFVYSDKSTIGNGDNNTFTGNSCYNIKQGYCIYLYVGALDNVVDCTNTIPGNSTGLVCNCDVVGSCGSPSPPPLESSPPPPPVGTFSRVGTSSDPPVQGGLSVFTPLPEYHDGNDRPAWVDAY